MIILPILSIVQGTHALKTSPDAMHSLSLIFHSAKQFKSSPPKQELNCFCFVSYPSAPSQISSVQLYDYLRSIQNMNSSMINISLVVHLPYHYKDGGLLLNSAKRVYKSLEDNLVARAKVRIRANKSVSSLAVYESAYEFCPHKSLMISSRHNIQFNKTFAAQVHSSLNEKFHYYHVNVVP